jgi:hypothetical protein
MKKLLAVIARNNVASFTITAEIFRPIRRLFFSLICCRGSASMRVAIERIVEMSHAIGFTSIRISLNNTEPNSERFNGQTIRHLVFLG